MIRHLTQVAFLVAAAAGAARADDCPTREVAAAGFVIEVSDAARLSISSEPGYLVKSTLFVNEKRAQETILYEGYFPLEEVSPSGTFHLRPPGELTNFFPPKAGASLTLNATPTFNGKPSKPWSIELNVIDEAIEKVGPCSYAVWRIGRKIVEEGGRVVANVVDHYNVDLRFVIAREVKKDDGTSTFQRYQEIRPRGRSGPL